MSACCDRIFSGNCDEVELFSGINRNDSHHIAVICLDLIGKASCGVHIHAFDVCGYKSYISDLNCAVNDIAELGGCELGIERLYLVLCS